jgi:hypothetical protein
LFQRIFFGETIQIVTIDVGVKIFLSGGDLAGKKQTKITALQRRSACIAGTTPREPVIDWVFYNRRVKE